MPECLGLVPVGKFDYGSRVAGFCHPHDHLYDLPVPKAAVGLVQPAGKNCQMFCFPGDLLEERFT